MLTLPDEELRMMRPALVLSGSVMLGLTACGSEEPEVVTWYDDVGHVLSANCVSCHQDGGLAGSLDFREPDIPVSMANLIAAVTEARVMPPFMAEETEECANPWGWKHDPRLTDEEIALLALWAELDAPIGEPDPNNPIPPPVEPGLEGTVDTAFPAGAYTTSPFGETTDEFLCFSVDLGLTESKWLNALEVIPDNREVVHHVLVSLDPTGSSAALADENGLYDCFGGTGTFVGAWVPGSAPIEFPAHTAFEMPPGARVTMQMHYHLLPDPEVDQTGIAVRWADRPPVRAASFNLFGNAIAQLPDGSGLQPGEDDPDGEAAFLIPAGSEAHEEVMWTSMLDQALDPREVFLAGNHMHYIGSGMRVRVERGEAAPAEAEDICLLETPRWDFEWQQFFNYPTDTTGGPTLYPGDDLWLECTYDNSLENPAVARALAESGLSDPIDVTVGEGSLDEMCVFLMGTVPAVPLTVEGETHAGEATLAIQSTAFGLDGPCDGVASLRAEEDGTIEGALSCGFALGALRATAVIDITASADATGNLNGEAALRVVDVTGSMSGTVSGSLDELNVTISGTLANGDVDIRGLVPLSAP
jgi:mono/diheme cytochrome c family protein